jgi:hypothetical protein
MQEDPKRNFTLMLPDSMRAQLEQIAKEQDRSLGKLILIFLNHAMAEYGANRIQYAPKPIKTELRRSA